MIDRDSSSVSDGRKRLPGPELSETTRRRDPSGAERPIDHLDIIALVRSLQRSAGLVDCFRTGVADCDVIDCAWRTHCLGNVPGRREED
jgi:hypothetical protein